MKECFPISWTEEKGPDVIASKVEGPSNTNPWTWQRFFNRDLGKMTTKLLATSEAMIRMEGC